MSNDLSDQMRTFGLTQRAVDLVRTHARILGARLGDVVDAYYAHLAATEMAPLMQTDRIDDLRAMRMRHWRLLLEGDFASIRADHDQRLGPRLVDGGFPRAIVVIAALWFATELPRVVDRTEEIPRTIRAELRAALVRVAFFDLALAQESREVAWLD